MCTWPPISTWKYKAQLCRVSKICSWVFSLETYNGDLPASSCGWWAFKQHTYFKYIIYINIHVYRDRFTQQPHVFVCSLYIFSGFAFTVPTWSWRESYFSLFFHSWTVSFMVCSLGAVVPSNCFQGRTSSLCWLSHLCILTSIGSAVSPRPFLSSLGASAKRVPMPSIMAVPSRHVALYFQLCSVYLNLWEGFQIFSMPQYLRREQWWVLSPWDLPRCLPHSPYGHTWGREQVWGENQKFTFKHLTFGMLIDIQRVSSWIYTSGV